MMRMKCLATFLGSCFLYSCCTILLVLFLVVVVVVDLDQHLHNWSRNGSIMHFKYTLRENKRTFDSIIIRVHPSACVPSGYSKTYSCILHVIIKFQELQTDLPSNIGCVLWLYTTFLFPCSVEVFVK